MRILAPLAALCLAAAVAACGDAQSPQQNGTKSVAVADPNAPLGQLPTSVTPRRYRLDLTLVPTEPRYSGVVEIEVELKSPARTVYLHGNELDVEPVTARLAGGKSVNGTYAQVHESGVARLTFDDELPAGMATLRLPFSTTFEKAPDALTVQTDSGEPYIWTQFESISARRAFPSFDEPRFKTPYDITVTARTADTVVTNTPPVNEATAAGGLKKITFATTEPLPTYLIAFAVGPYDVEEGPTIPPSRLRQAPIPLRGIAVAGKGERTRFALVQTPPQLRYLEEYFAAPYPYPKLDLIAPPNFSAGGMENAGAITYTERGILLDDASAVQQKRYFTLLHAHELAHQWFGDLVTPKWWDDIWLNESFATWMGNKASAAVWPDGDFARETVRDALAVMDTDSLASARAIRQPIASNDDIVNAFDGLTYDKGGGVLAMFESFLGPDAFREGVRTHMRRFPHGVADARDFMESLAQGSARPEIVPAFSSFLNQPGVPLVHVKAACAGRDLSVELTQSPYGAENADDKRLWQIPVCMRDMNRARPASCTLMTGKSTTVTLANQCGAAIFPNADGAGYYRFSMPRDAWQAFATLTPKMTPAEQLATLHSLRAAFRAGDADAAIYLGAIQSVSGSAPWDVLELTREFLAEIRGNLLARADLPRFEQRTRAWFAPAMTRMGLEPGRREPPASALARAELAEIMVKVARDPATLSPLAAAGAARLRALARGETPASMTPELIPVALWAAVFTGGGPVARDAMTAIKGSSDADFRTAAVRALVAARDPQAIKEIEEFVGSGALTAREMLRTYMREVFADDERRARAWTWLRDDFKRLAARVPKDGRARFIRLTELLCGSSSKAEIEWFFKPMLAEIPGAPRVFANTLETVDRCVSWRKAHGADLAAALR